jgi:glycerophosphoryl diester phosphodiesterase
VNIREIFNQVRRQEKLLIAAHRGTSGGNITCNTIAAYENALRHKADIVELDGAMTRDGVFYAFHDENEALILGTGRNIRTMDSRYVDQLFLRNPYLDLTTEHLSRLEEVFAYLKGRCIINLDRTWFYWDKVLALINRTPARDQILIKSPVREEYLQTLEALAPDLAYVAMLEKPGDDELVRKYKINYAAAEVSVESEDAPFAGERFIKKIHDAGQLLWLNVISIDESLVQSAGHDDWRAIMEGPEKHWRWCVDRGFDILQTDWPLLLWSYLDSLGRAFRP